MIVGGVGGARERLPIGPAGTVPTSDGTDVAWAAPASGGGDTDEYDFSSSTGITLSSPSGAGETAAVTGGALVLSIPDGVRRDYSAGAQESPWASVSLLDDGGRAPSRVRVQARVTLTSSGSLDPSTVARLVLIASDGSRVAVWVKRDYWSYAYRTSVDSSANGTAPTVAGSWPAKADLDEALASSGTVWVGVRIDGATVVTYYGLGVGGAEPTTWTEHARVNVTDASGVPLRWTTAALTASHEDASSDGDLEVTWHSLSVTRGAP